MFGRLRYHRFCQKHPNLLFWGAFATLNFLIFLPIALLDDQSRVLPPVSMFNDGWWMAVNRIFIWRENLDPLRLSLELTVMATLWVWLGRLRRRWLGVLFGAIYMMILIYAIYEAIVVSVYLLEPSFYSQFYLARDGLPFLFEHVNTGWWLYVSGVAGLMASAGVVAWLWSVLLYSGAAPGLLRRTRVGVTILAALSLTVTATYQVYTAQPEMVVSSFGFKLQKNLEASAKIHQDVLSFDDAIVRNVYDYAEYRLEQKPDIYIIFVESYGSVLYKRPHFTPPYRALLNELEDAFDNAGWSVRTALSEAPTWGGGSWLSYTSTLFGMRIDNHPQYLELRNKYQVDRYPSLGATLHDQGYHYVWLSALDENISDIGWAKYTRMLAVDELIRYRDMEYIGPRYGWGPAPPDQWVLHWAHERLKATTDKPLIFFTITQNSHYPWTPHPELVEDWRTLNQPGQEEPPVDPESISLDVMRANYLNAINYQLRMLTQLILETGDEKSIFVLIGDHQPPAVSRRADGWSTPIHIISKDAAFVDAFSEYGFTPGLLVENLEPSLRHEGFYSMFMRALLGHYGVNKLAQPVYLPTGIVPAATEATN